MLFQRLFGIIPAGIGLTLLGFLWLQPWGAFHSPPLFFRIMGSFVALMFVMVGLAISFARPRSPTDLLHRAVRELSPRKSPDPEKSDFACRHCGAPLGNGVDVSPHGDVKCGHCNRWFNIHQAE